MDINELTIGQAKQIIELLCKNETTNSTSLNCMIGKKCIIRTYSAGVWFGTVEQKSGKEVILKDARRMWKWWANESISLSAVAVYGLKQSQSKIAPKVENVWLEAIEIIPTNNISTKSIEDCKDATAE